MELDNDVYIYALVDPRDKKIRYIGKTIDPEGRHFQHIHDKNVNAGKVAWVAELGKEDLVPAMEVLELTDEDNWPDREKWWIERGREFGWGLLNLTNGGDGHLFHIPTYLHEVLPEVTWKRFEGLSNKQQGRLLIKAATACVDYFVAMIECRTNEDIDGYWYFKEKAKDIALGYIIENVE